MLIEMSIKTENAAFSDNPEELREVLEKAVEKILRGDDRFKLMDSNGQGRL